MAGISHLLVQSSAVSKCQQSHVPGDNPNPPAQLNRSTLRRHFVALTRQLGRFVRGRIYQA
jgi:hypothetical protein